MIKSGFITIYKTLNSFTNQWNRPIERIKIILKRLNDLSNLNDELLNEV